MHIVLITAKDVFKCLSELFSAHKLFYSPPDNYNRNFSSVHSGFHIKIRDLDNYV